MGYTTFSDTPIYLDLDAICCRCQNIFTIHVEPNVLDLPVARLVTGKHLAKPLVPAVVVLGQAFWANE